MPRFLSKPRKLAQKVSGGTANPPNPYLMVFLTATLAGLFFVVGGYCTAGFQARYAIAQKQLEYRVSA